MLKRNVFIIGAGGMVGATAAQAIAMKELVDEVVLIDVAQELVHGQAMDINHATAYTNGVHVRVGEYSEIEEDDIIIITCGAAQRPGQTRLELLEINARIIKNVVRQIMEQDKQVYILVVSNPVDILTYIAQRESGLPKERVFGSGTTLDTARLRVTLANRLHVSQQHVHAYILGEHGDSSFPALAGATISGIPLGDFPGFRPKMIAGIDADIRQAAYKIIEAKRSTYYGIGQTIAKLVEALLRENRSIFPVCSLATGEYGLHDMVIGLPHFVSKKGVSIINNYPLSEQEVAQLHHSAQVIKESIGPLQFEDKRLELEYLRS